MKEIQLTRGMVALVDDENFDFLNQFRWYALKNSKTYYAQRFQYINGREEVVKMHRLIMNTPSGMEVDHVDHNGLNNQKYNLRNCTPAQNRKNRCAWGKSKYLGVTFNCGKPQAGIKINGVFINLGIFNTEEAAAHAYDKAALEYHKEFANLNFKER